MELSKAKEILKEWLEYNKKNRNVLREADTIIAVQETILKALDNSISKDEIRKVRDNLEMKDYYLSRDGADDLTRLLGEEVEEWLYEWRRDNRRSRKIDR